MKMVLLGAPGSGKGTHAKYLQEKYNLTHISTGDIFREAIKNRTPLGIIAKSHIDLGHLVPDDLTIELVKERLQQPDCANGFLLDGFPRTLEQGKALNEITNLDMVLYFDIDLDDSLRRILSRRMCSKCGTIYNLLSYSKSNCDICGADLVLRDDDTEEVVLERFKVYKELTHPLVDFYENQHLLMHINARKSIEDIRKELDQLIGDFKR